MNQTSPSPAPLSDNPVPLPGASEETQKSSHTSVFIFFGIIAFCAVGLGGVLLGKYLYAPKTPSPELSVTPTPRAEEPTVTPTPDFSASWKLVINQTFGFSIHYPDNWIAECTDPIGNWSSANICDFRAPNTVIDHGQLFSGANIVVGVEKPNQNYNTLEEKIAFDTKTYGYTAIAKTINDIEGYLISSPGNDAFVTKNGEYFIIVSWIPLPDTSQYKNTLDQIFSTFKFIE